jgi:hypothetical protein
MGHDRGVSRMLSFLEYTLEPAHTDSIPKFFQSNKNNVYVSYSENVYQLQPRVGRIYENFFPAPIAA